MPFQWRFAGLVDSGLSGLIVARACMLARDFKKLIFANCTPCFGFLSGMITGFLIKVVGCGKTSAFGAILTPLGYIVSYFAESVLFLIISLGVVSGK